MKNINLIFPHQLFEQSPLFEEEVPVVLVEEFLFFRQYPFHKQKIAYHRASMQAYQEYLRQAGKEVHYIDANDARSDLRDLLPGLKAQGVEHINYIDPADYWIEQRLSKGCADLGISTRMYKNPSFLLSREELLPFFKSDKKKFYQTAFYKEQRKKRKLLLVDGEHPEGGKWTYDTENRKKYPAKKTPPSIQFPDSDAFFEEAKDLRGKAFFRSLWTTQSAPALPS